MAQYETVNGVPKLISKSKGRYLDKDGQLKDVKDLPDYKALIKSLSENGHDATYDLAKLGGMGTPMMSPSRKRMNAYVTMAYPYTSYHARYMRELSEIASRWLLSRLVRQKDLMRGINAYKNHIDKGKEIQLT